MWLTSRESYSYPPEVCYYMSSMGLAEGNIGWLEDTGVADLTGKLFLSPRGLLLCEQHGAG